MKTYLPLGAAAAALAVVGLLLLFRPGGDSKPTSQPTASATPTASTATVTPNLGGGGEPLPAQVAAQRKIVAGFAKVFTSTVSQQRWIEDLRPYVTAELLAGFRHTDPRVRPAGEVEQIRYIDSAGVFRVDYRGGQPILIRLAPAGTSWGITSVTPVDPAPAAPPPPTSSS